MASESVQDEATAVKVAVVRYMAVEIARLLSKNDFRVSGHLEGGERASWPLHVVRFDGGYPDEGFRAAELVRLHGYPLACLRRVWNYDSEAQDDPCWEMTFYPDVEISLATSATS